MTGKSSDNLPPCHHWPQLHQVVDNTMTEPQVEGAYHLERMKSRFQKFWLVSFTDSWICWIFIGFLCHVGHSEWCNKHNTHGRLVARPTNYIELHADICCNGKSFLSESNTPELVMSSSQNIEVSPDLDRFGGYDFDMTNKFSNVGKSYHKPTIWEW